MLQNAAMNYPNLFSPIGSLISGNRGVYFLKFSNIHKVKSTAGF